MEVSQNSTKMKAQGSAQKYVVEAKGTESEASQNKASAITSTAPKIQKPSKLFKNVVQEISFLNKTTDSAATNQPVDISQNSTKMRAQGSTQKDIEEPKGIESKASQNTPAFIKTKVPPSPPSKPENKASLEKLERGSVKKHCQFFENQNINNSAGQNRNTLPLRNV